MSLVWLTVAVGPAAAYGEVPRLCGQLDIHGAGPWFPARPRAERMRISWEHDNPAAAALYLDVGSTPTQRMSAYKRQG